MTIPLPTRTEMLAMPLPVEVTARGVTYRYATEQARDAHLKAESKVLRGEKL